MTTRAPQDTDLGREVATLEHVLREHGPLTRRELGARSGCRTWGPGRFGQALRQAAQDGRIAREGRDRYRAG